MSRFPEDISSHTHKENNFVKKKKTFFIHKRIYLGPRYLVAILCKYSEGNGVKIKYIQRIQANIIQHGITYIIVGSVVYSVIVYCVERHCFITNNCDLMLSFFFFSSDNTRIQRNTPVQEHARTLDF